jgi:LysM repeat protein
MLTPKPSNPGPERIILALALCLPLGLMAVALAQMPGVNLGLPSSVVYADSDDRLMARRPAPSNPAPPPTLAVPTATPKATPAPIDSPTPVASSTPRTGRNYTVQPGDELKQIAATYHMTVWQIIDANNIPNPDTLRVGQVLKIPDS